MSQSSRQSPVSLDTSRIQGENSDSSARQTDSSSAAPSTRAPRLREHGQSSTSSASLPPLSTWSQSLERPFQNTRPESTSNVVSLAHQHGSSASSRQEGRRADLTSLHESSTPEPSRAAFPASSSHESSRPRYSELPPIDSRGGESQSSFRGHSQEGFSTDRNLPPYSEASSRLTDQPPPSQSGHDNYIPASQQDQPTPHSPMRPALSVSTAVANSDYRMMTFETESGNYSVPVDVRAASKVADEKRRRNAGASARFRARRKEREHQNTQEIETLKTQVHELSEDAAFYRAERDFYRAIVQRGPEADRHLPRPASPRLRRLSRTGSDYSSGPVQSPGRSTAYGFEEHGQQGSGGRYSRRRLSTPFEMQRYPPGPGGQSQLYPPHIPFPAQISPLQSQSQYTTHSQSVFAAQYPHTAPPYSQPPPSMHSSYLSQRRSLPGPHIPPPPPPPPPPRPNLQARHEPSYEISPGSGRPPQLPPPPPPQR